MTDTPAARLRDRWLEAFLPEVAFDGWTENGARKAAETAGLTPGEQALAAPGGVGDLIEHFFDRAEDKLGETLSGRNLDDLPVHKRVAEGVAAWLAALEHREAVRRAIGWGALPWRAGQPMQRAWRVADLIWTAAGDTATDYNRYSKRGLLASTLPAIVFHWLDETDPEAVDAFILRRLKSASSLGRAGGKILGPLLDRFKAPEPAP